MHFIDIAFMLKLRMRAKRMQERNPLANVWYLSILAVWNRKWKFQHNYTVKASFYALNYFFFVLLLPTFDVKYTKKSRKHWKNEERREKGENKEIYLKKIPKFKETTLSRLHLILCITTETAFCFGMKNYDLL